MRKTMKCPQCSKEIADDDAFCPFCGANVKAGKDIIQPEVVNNGEAAKGNPSAFKHSSVLVLAILSIILGAIGLGIVGIILGAVALTLKPTRSEKTIAIVGIVLSACLSWVWFVWH